MGTRRRATPRAWTLTGLSKLEVAENGAAVRSDHPSYCPDRLGAYFSLPTLQLPDGQPADDSGTLRTKANLLRGVQVRAEAWLTGADGRLVETSCRAALFSAAVSCE